MRTVNKTYTYRKKNGWTLFDDLRNGRSVKRSSMLKALLTLGAQKLWKDFEFKVILSHGSSTS